MLLLSQGPVNDVVTVTFPNDVQVGSQVLKAGEYTVKQLSSSSNPRILEFSTEKGTSIQATATAIAALDNNNRNDTSVILESQGGMQHVHRIWLKGKSYGYEFPIQPAVMTAAAAPTTTIVRETKVVANYVPPAEPVVVAQAPPPPPEPAPEPVQVAQAAPPPPPPPQQAPEPEPVPQTPAMPKTASYGGLALAAGSALLLAGGLLRARR